MNQHEQNAYDYPEGHYLRLPKPTDKRGLCKKFTVTRTDGKDKPGAKYFVLDYANDFHARAALRAYIESCGRGDKKDAVLAADLKAALEACGLTDRAQEAMAQIVEEAGPYRRPTPAALNAELAAVRRRGAGQQRVPNGSIPPPSNRIPKPPPAPWRPDRWFGTADLLAQIRDAAYNRGPYDITRWTDEVRHDDPCDCDEDNESVGNACMDNSDWFYALHTESGEWLRPLLKLPRRPPARDDDAEDQETPTWP